MKPKRSHRGVRGARFKWRGSEFTVFSFPVEVQVPSNLTAAEREVSLRVLAGESDAEIARARATSVRTVANQLRSAFRKLDVSSRAELCARLAGQRRS